MSLIDFLLSSYCAVNIDIFLLKLEVFVCQLVDQITLHNNGGNYVSIFIWALVFVLCDLENDFYKMYRMFPDFFHEIRTRA